MRFEHTCCNLCNSDAVRQVGKRKSPDRDPKLETNIVRCRLCGLMYPDPMPRREKDEIKNDFKNPEKYFSGDVTNKRIKNYERVMRLIEKYKCDKGSLLDIGCGRGEMVHVASGRNWRVTGTEISESFAQYAKEKFNKDVLVGDINDLELPEKNFDVACLNSVIQYVQDPLRTLKKINSLLKKNGILYIEVTNEDAFVFKIGDFFKTIKEGGKVTTHLSPMFPSFQIYGFNKKSLLQALGKSGFKVFYMKIKGATGGGDLKGHGISTKIINFVRKIIISIGGLTGTGHLIWCLAKKGDKDDSDRKT